MKKKDIIEGKIIKTEFPNKGTFICEDQKVTVKGVIDGQTIKGQVTKKRKSGCVVRLLDVLEKSPLEDAKPVCPHFGICGGCFYQTVSYENQLKIKEGMVRDLLKDYVNDDIWEEIKGSPKVHGYRNKMEFSFGDEYKGGPLALGMHRRGSFYDIVNTPQCHIVHEDFRKILTATLEYFTEKGMGYYRKLQHEGYLRHLLVRRAVKTGEILVALVTSGQTGKEGMPQSLETEKVLLEEWKKTLLALKMEGSFAGILHIRNDTLADVVQSDETTVLYGKGYFYEELLGLKFQITPFSFFQTNSLGAEVLYETARGYVGETKDKVVFDLYSGTGTISQIIAPVAKKVVGVEIVEEAVGAAKENAEANGLHNCEFIAGDVLKVIDEITEKPDLIILDPPRDGIHPKALDRIINFGVDHLVYISCKPTSLVRDLVILQERGYKLERAVAVDMFPATANCETVVLLSKGEVDSKKIRVEFSLEDMDMSEFQDGATYTQIKDYVLEHSGLKVSNLYISQIKRKCGIEVGKNYNLPKSEDSRQPMCPPEKEKAIREAFKYFGMI